VSPAAAQDDYGVVVRRQDEEFVLDAAATETHRQSRRPAAKLFHNGQYVEAMD
jgi:hypothetical protein